jgi:uncharacterized protein (DUF3084 family)
VYRYVVEGKLRGMQALVTGKGREVATAHDKMAAAEDELASLHARLRAHTADVRAREKVVKERGAAVGAREVGLYKLNPVDP